MSNLINILSGFLENFIYIILEMSPFLLLGFFIAGILNVFMPSNLIYRFFGKNKFGSSVNAALVGIPLPLCSCGVIPTGLSLYKNGASKGSTFSFLISTPQTGVDSILVTYSLLGLPFAIVRPIAAFVTGVLGGYIGNIVEPTILTPREENKEEKVKQNIFQKIIAVFRYGFIDFMSTIAKWLAIGIILAAAISAIIPDNFFGNYNIPVILQMLIILAISIPLYTCATASVPLAAVLIMKGLSPGAALVMLMAGPATSLASITLIGKVMGKKSLFVYLVSIISGAIFFGLIIHYVLPPEWFQITTLKHAHHQMTPYIMQLISGIVLTLLITYHLTKKYFVKPKTIKSEPNMNIEKFEVKGMTCSHCKNTLETNLKKLEFVQTVNINLDKNEVEIQGENINNKVIEDTINNLGYEYVGKKDNK